MKLNRRMFFGAAAGGAVAGPSMAQEALSQGSRLLRSADLGGLSTQKLAYAGMDAAKTVAGSGSDYRIERIADLKRILSGESKEDKRSRQRELIQYLEKVDEARLDTLKSVSLGRKVIMLADGRAARYQRMRELDAQWELEELENNLLKFPWSS